ncbi:HTTM domain-containing protein [Aeromicrobium sp. Leaf350]|uniref:HTTM domain-containing protein n=1 Tax=Aeromicrobium sp. Leaf350 TaxID=2876565 RepID=UPI001E47BF8D|nr:HTTM domain-containing protein [Aeromicrobium sp. Leaf350]
MTSPAATVATSVDRLVDWLTTSRWSTFGLAATRMTIAFTILVQLAVGFADRQYIWGVGHRWAEPFHERQAVVTWIPWLPAAPAWATDVALLASVVAGVALLVGWHTRTACIATFLLWALMIDASPILRSGAEDVVRLVLFYLCFSDSGVVASLDARRRRRKDRGEPRHDWLAILLNNVAVVLIAHQIVMIYVGSALWKFDGPAWLDGTAVYYPLQVNQYSPWLAELDWLYTWSPFVMGATWSAMIIQLGFPLLLLTRRTRIIGFVLITGTHLGIGVLMGLMYFSLAMIAADAVLISDDTWRSAARNFRDRRNRWVRRAPQAGEGLESVT